MKVRLSGILYYYLIFSFTALISIIGYGGYYYWEKGIVNFDYVNKVFEASFKFDEIKERKDIAHLKKLIENDRLRESIKSLEKFESNLKKLDFMVVDKKISKNLKTSIKKTRNSMMELLSFPELSSIIFVLGNKVTKFGNFVNQKQWRTLSRMAKIMMVKMSPGKIKRPGFFSYEKLERFGRKLKYDLSRMKGITNTSLLKRNDKNIILNNLKTLNTEIFMLERYLGFLKKLIKNIDVLNKNFKSWGKIVGPEILLNKLRFYKNSKQLLTSIGGLFLFNVLCLFLGIIINKIKFKKDKLIVENLILKSIGEGIIPLKNRLKMPFSNHFNENFKKYKGFLHRRMEFGAIFQEGVPFSAILIDSNLNIIWGNKLFYEDWALIDYKERNDQITWDFIKKFTNLGESNPIISALKENVAGIYQIQVKIKKETMPYEMYVSPINYADKTKIMIIFYPLRSLEETLVNQTKAIIGPVSRSLDALMTNHFNLVFKEKIESDFVVAGIEELFEKFNKYNDFVCQQRVGLLKEIERLENSLYDQYKLIDDLIMVFDKKKLIQKDEIKNFENTKKCIIGIIDLKSSIENETEDILIIMNDLFKSQNDLLKKSENIKVLFEENKKSFDRIFHLKNGVKDIRDTIFEFRNKIVRSIDQSLSFQKSENASSKLGQSLSKIKFEVVGFEKVLHNFSSIMTGLDVALSKVQLLMENKELPQFENIRSDFNQSKNDLDSAFLDIKEFRMDGDEKSEDMVGNLKNLYANFLDSSEKHKMVEDLIQISRKNPEYGSLSVNQIDFETKKKYGDELNL